VDGRPNGVRRWQLSNNNSVGGQPFDRRRRIVDIDRYEPRLRRRGTEKAVSWDTSYQSIGKLADPAFDPVGPDFFDRVDRFPERDVRCRVRRSDLEPPRTGSVLVGVGGRCLDTSDSRPSAARGPRQRHGRRRGSRRPTARAATCGRRRRQRQRPTPRRPSGAVQGPGRRRRAQRTGIVGDIDQLRYRKLRPMGPRNRAVTGESGVGDGLGEPIRIDSAVLRLDDANLDALSFEALPYGDSLRRMLEIRPDDEVAGLPVDRVGDRVDPGRGAFSECDFVRRRRRTSPTRTRSAVKRLKRSPT